MADFATPHVAGYSYDGKIRGTYMIYEAACAFYFKSKTWRAEKCIQEGAAQNLDLRKCPTPLAKAVGASCPIMDDDARLRETLMMHDAKKRAKHFDGLRAGYPGGWNFPIFHCNVRMKLLARPLTFLGHWGFAWGCPAETRRYEKSDSCGNSRPFMLSKPYSLLPCFTAILRPSPLRVIVSWGNRALIIFMKHRAFSRPSPRPKFQTSSGWAMRFPS